MTARYERSSTGLQALLNADDMARAMSTAGAAGAAAFESIAPQKSGAYKASLRSTPEVSTLPTPRRAQRLEATTDYAADVERRHGTLSKVADVLEQGGRR